MEGVDEEYQEGEQHQWRVALGSVRTLGLGQRGAETVVADVLVVIIDRVGAATVSASQFVDGISKLMRLLTRQ